MTIFVNLLYYLILAIPLFFIFVWLIGKFVKSKKYKFIISGILAVLLTPVVFQLFVFIFFQQPEKKFDSSAWQTEINQRYQMAEDIIDNKLFIEKDSNQVKKLLGEPTRRDSVNKWTYFMGQGGGGLGVLFHYLIISFDNGNVYKVLHGKVQD